MRYILILVFLLLLVFNMQGQRLSIAPYSFKAWGSVSDAGLFSIDYKDFSLHYFYVYKEKEYGKQVRNVVEIYSGNSQSTMAVSYLPADIAGIIRMGVMASIHRFPTKESNRLNFWLEAGYELGGVRLSYVHISNGFGIFNRANPGLDTIRMSIAL